MATGDVEGNLERLKAQLRSVSYPHTIDNQGLRMGLPSAVLPLLHHALLGYSRHVFRYLSTNGYELYAKSDLRFIECILKFLRTEFGYRCSLTLAQIFSKGFSERKMIFVHDVVQSESVMSSRHKRISRNEEVNEERKSPSLRIKTTSSPRCKNKLPSISTMCKLAIELSPTPRLNFEQPGIQVDHDEMEDRSSPCYIPDNEKQAQTDFQVKSPTQIGGIDSSLPRELDRGIRKSPDASLPRKMDTHKSLSSEMTSRKCSISPSTSEDDEAAPVVSMNVAAITSCYDEIKLKIGEIAEKLGSRFSTLEESLSKTTQTLEARFCTLESRIRLLEKSFFPKASPISYLPENLSCGLANLTTQQLIDSIKARCQKTKELLSGIY
ncbi:hypothetical protein SELMODRAFT_432026 [Selaginella moellendorffii]|uniref:Centrosomal protein of 44 kDa n=1 Tax=Selaginella moellendorffii TaxID=88036 RepID=D8TER3_SELML|nr:hypothetical protein SELMODRAFT_432026 [Selaginella moellendorffii]